MNFLTKKLLIRAKLCPIILCLCLATFVWGQADSNRIRLSVQIGTRLHDDGHEVVRATSSGRIVSAPIFGLMLTMPRIPLRFGWQTDFSMRLVPHVINPSAELPVTIGETRIEHQFQMYYDFKHFFVGVGGYWKRREAVLHYLFPGFLEWKHKGVQLSVGVPLNWIDIELRTKIRLDPTFASIVGASHYSLLFLYNVDKIRKTKFRNEKIIVNGLIGARFFLTNNIRLLTGEDLTPIGIAPLLGLEFLHRKTGLSLNLERDWWIAVNGGGLSRELKGYINSSFIGLGYHYQLRNNRFLRFKIGGSFISDFDFITWNSQNLDSDKARKLANYQVKGIGTMVSYEIQPGTDIELKHTFPLIGDVSFFNVTRLSVGLVYRYNPSK